MKKTVIALVVVLMAMALCFAWAKSPYSLGAKTEKEALAPYVEALGSPQGVSPIVYDGQLATEYSWAVGGVRRAITVVETDRGWGVVQLREYPVVPQ